jgi:hypothetical protein
MWRPDVHQNTDPASELSAVPADDSGILTPEQLLELADAIAAMLADTEPHSQS